MTADWSYEPPTGPKQWGSLDPAWVMADVGYRQSPVELGPAVDGHVERIAVTPAATAMSRTVTQHGTQLVPDVPVLSSVGSQELRLVGLHMHTPAEHIVQGHQAAAEVHLVHVDDEGRLVVFGVFVEETDEPSPAVIPFLEAGSDGDSVTLKVSDLVPAPGSPVYSYVGSLTTPPCSEGVAWYVFDVPIYFSTRQLAELAALQGASNRPVQPLHGRRIVKG